ncbi:MAG: MBL fold metallo-hydrolase [Opitutales bacterium]
MSKEIELEDELGDVLEKAMKNAGLTEELLAERTGIAVGKIKDAEDYRYDFTPEEIAALAQILGLNEAGLRKLNEEAYPRPALRGLPFELHVLAMPFGVGVVNAYVLSIHGSGKGILFDTGKNFEDLKTKWPTSVRDLQAVFLTHWDRDHAGGLSGLLQAYEVPRIYAPQGPGTETTLLNGGEQIELGDFSIQVFDTPGHVSNHNSYLVSLSSKPQCGSVLIAGDLVFAGSVGGAFYSGEHLLHNVQWILSEVDGETVVAPGHGPLTTVANERTYNPFYRAGEGKE